MYLLDRQVLLGMKLQLKCDRCGKIGTKDEVYPVGYDGVDLCRRCELLNRIEENERMAAGEQERADEHLADVQAYRQQIEEYKAELAKLS